MLAGNAMKKGPAQKENQLEISIYAQYQGFSSNGLLQMEYPDLETFPDYERLKLNNYIYADLNN